MYTCFECGRPTERPASNWCSEDGFQPGFCDRPDCHQITETYWVLATMARMSRAQPPRTEPQLHAHEVPF